MLEFPLHRAMKPTLVSPRVPTVQPADRPAPRAAERRFRKRATALPVELEWAAEALVWAAAPGSVAAEALVAAASPTARRIQVAAEALVAAASPTARRIQVEGACCMHR